MTISKTIHKLKQEGWKNRTIAAQVGISETQVRRYLAGYEGPQKKSRQESDITAIARRMLREAKTEAEKACVRNNFGDVL